MGWIDKFKFALGIGKSQPEEFQGHEESLKVSDWQPGPDWKGMPFEGDDVHLEFAANLQLRTPLRVLSKHLSIHKGTKSPPPEYAKEPWEGIWVPCITDPAWDFLNEGVMSSSDIGEVPKDGGDYLPYLISVRKIVETDLPIEERREQLKLSDNTSGAALADQFFPPFIETIKGLTKDSITELHKANLKTPESLEMTSDESLLKIKGIGPSKLKEIRKSCAISTDKLCEWAESPSAKTR